MKGRNSLDVIEFGEDDAVKERATEGEILNRLESLRKRGLVEKVMDLEVGDNSAPLIYRIKTSG
jgi:hypothetical protein